MKQVWILNHYAQEPGGAGGTRHFHLAEHLRAHGWQAIVIAASVELNTGRQRLAPHESTRHERIGSVPFLWVRTPGYRGNGGGRALNMLAYTWQAIRRRTTRDLPRPDAVIGSSVHPFAAVAGAWLAGRFKVPFVFEVRDLWPQTLVNMGRLREEALLTWALRRLEVWLYRRAARIIVLLPRAWEYIVPLGIPRKRIVWIPNGVDLRLFPCSAPAEGELDAPFTLMYFGAHGQANGLDGVLQAMKLVQEANRARPVLLRLIGDGPLKASLQAQALRMQLDNVRFESAVPKSAIPAVAAQADAFVMVVLDLPGLYRYGISMNKLYDYLAATRPVILASSAANNPVVESGAGPFVGAGNPAEMAAAILELAATPPEERLRMGRSGRSYVERNHDFRILAARLAASLDEVCAAERLETATP